MNNSENNNNEILSFEELRKKLGMDEPPKTETKPNNTEKSVDTTSSTDDIFAQIEQTLNETTENETVNESKHIVENGKTFVDITEQYVKKETVTGPEIVTEEKAETVTVTPKKKKVRTFNEIFSDFFKGFIPLKKDSTKEKIRKIIMDVAIITIIGCCFAFADLYVERQVQLKQKEEIKETIVETDDFDDNQYVEAWQDVFAKYPTIQFPENMNLKYSYLYAVNQDLVGWVKIDNTNLDVQVVQSSDNDYYLNHSFDKSYKKSGWTFMDYRNSFVISAYDCNDR